MTTTSPYTGTERYKAPEQFASTENDYPLATFEGDIYGFGCVALSVCCFLLVRIPSNKASSLSLQNYRIMNPEMYVQKSKTDGLQHNVHKPLREDLCSRDRSGTC